MVGAGTSFGIPMGVGSAGARIFGGKPQLVKLASHGFGRAALSVTDTRNFIPNLQVNPTDFIPALSVADGLDFLPALQAFPMDDIPGLGFDSFQTENPNPADYLLQAQELPTPAQFKKAIFKNNWVKKYVKTVKPYTGFLGVYNTKENIVGGSSAILTLVSALVFGWGTHHMFCKKPPPPPPPPQLHGGAANINPSSDTEFNENLANEPALGLLGRRMRSDDGGDRQQAPASRGDGPYQDGHNVPLSHRRTLIRLEDSKPASDLPKAKSALPAPVPIPLVPDAKPAPASRPLDQREFGNLVTAPPARQRSAAPDLVSMRGEDVEPLPSEVLPEDPLREFFGTDTSALLEDSDDQLGLDNTLDGVERDRSSETYIDLDNTIVLPGAQDIPPLPSPDALRSHKAGSAPLSPPADPAPRPAQVVPPQPPEQPAQVAAPNATNNGFPNIPGYVIIKELGEGGMGTVYLAHKERMPSLRVAIKVILLSKREAARMAVDFRKEADSMAKIDDYAHVVQLFDFDRTEDGLLYMVMEYCKNGNLHEWVKKNKPVPEKTVINYGKQIAQGLQAFYEAGETDYAEVYEALNEDARQTEDERRVEFLTALYEATKQAKDEGRAEHMKALYEAAKAAKRPGDEGHVKLLKAFYVAGKKVEDEGREEFLKALYEVAEAATEPESDDRVEAVKVLYAEGYLEDLNALYEAAKHGLIHRDLKPANILLDSRYRVKITDFGLAKAASNTMTTQGIRGTPSFMAPEQITNPSSTNIRADIFAAGAILYYLATGKLAFKAKDKKAPPEAQLIQIATDKMYGVFQDPREHRRDLSQGLVDIIYKAIEADPDDRYQTPQELYDALSELE